MPRDAEAWLADRGIDREPIRLTPTETEQQAAERPDDARDGDRVAHPPDAAAPGPAPSAREAVQLAQAVAVDTADAQERAAGRPVAGPSLADDVAAALDFVRRSTATAPQSVGRLRSKLTERGSPTTAVDQALDRAHAEGLVDDAAMAAALVEEGRVKGHAPTRLRADLARRGFARDVIDRALQVTDGEDLEAVAYDVAAHRAERLTGVEAETAVRRLVGHLARRGYPEGLARKVARDAVYTSRDAARTAER